MRSSIPLSIVCTSASVKAKQHLQIDTPCGSFAARCQHQLSANKTTIVTPFYIHALINTFHLYFSDYPNLGSPLFLINPIPNLEWDCFPMPSYQYPMGNPNMGHTNKQDKLEDNPKALLWRKCSHRCSRHLYFLDYLYLDLVNPYHFLINLSYARFLENPFY